MIVVDSSAWIDYFNGVDSTQSSRRDELLGTQPVLVGDLILTEVLPGFRHDADHPAAREAVTPTALAPMAGPARTVRAADHYRSLRSRGVKARRTMDVLIGTFCLEEGHPLLSSDGDFEPLVAHLGLGRAE